MLVSTNIPILLDWGGHINVKYSGTALHIVYTYDYLYKGNEKTAFKITMDVEQQPQAQPQNEIEKFLKGRTLCSMDAVWRILGYHTYPKSNPSVRLIKVILPDVMNHWITVERKWCDLTVYMNRPACLHHMKYTEVFSRYVTAATLPARFLNKPECENTVQGYFEITVQGLKPTFLCKRAQETFGVVRMQTLYIDSGEIYYLRVLLYRRAVISFADAYGGQPTFQESCIQQGFITEDDEAYRSFLELLATHNANKLRGLFATLMMEGFAVKQIFNDPVCVDAMIYGWFPNGSEPSREHAINRLLIATEKRLNTADKTLATYGFPVPHNMNTLLEREIAKYPQQQQAELLQSLDDRYPNNEKQQEIFEEVTSVIQHYHENPGTLTKDIFFYVDGAAGTGKTNLFKKIMAFSRSIGVIIGPVAATTLAALNINATTAHSYWGYPVVDEKEKDENFPEVCQAFQSPGRNELIRNTLLIPWDEIVSNDRDIIESSIRSSKPDKAYFIYLLGGDFRQIPPVVKNGKKYEVIQRLISSSYIWPQVKIFTLTENMRLKFLSHKFGPHPTPEQQLQIDKQLLYAEVLLHIANNTSMDGAVYVDDGDNEDEKYLTIPMLTYFVEDVDLLAAIDFLYPGRVFDPACARENVILATTNKCVQEWNDIIQALNPQPTKVLLARNKFCEVDDPYGILAGMIDDKVLEKYNVHGFPPHELKLKVDDICLVCRAIKTQNVPSNSRVQIVAIGEYLITAIMLNDNNRVVYLPRINFKIKLPWGYSYTMLRTQFPLTLAYSMTYNKSQSQTLARVLLDCRDWAFMHGHFYVGTSRVYIVDNIRLYVRKEHVYYDGEEDSVIVKNVVYKDILLPNT